MVEVDGERELIGFSILQGHASNSNICMYLDVYVCLEGSNDKAPFILF